MSDMRHSWDNCATHFQEAPLHTQCVGVWLGMSEIEERLAAMERKLDYIVKLLLSKH